MPQMTLEDFMTQQTCNVLDFSAAWRDHNKDKPNAFPLLMNDRSWFCQYLSFMARKIEDACKQQAIEKLEEEAKNALTVIKTVEVQEDTNQVDGNKLAANDDDVR